MIGPAGFMAAPKSEERPEFGTAPIRCGKSRCKWRGFETDLVEVKTPLWITRVCPLCGCESYSFMTPREIQAWDRKRKTTRKFYNKTGFCDGTLRIEVESGNSWIVDKNYKRVESTTAFPLEKCLRFVKEGVWEER